MSLAGGAVGRRSRHFRG